jgi:hypothetical protein
MHTFGAVQVKVLSFRLMNGPATFQPVMNDVFDPLLNTSFIVDLDDILILSCTAEEHFHHVKQVLDILRSGKFYAELNK